MKTRKFRLTSLCYGVVKGKNRGLEVYYRDELISRYRSISKCGGLKATLELAKKDAYKSINHSK